MTVTVECDVLSVEDVFDMLRGVDPVAVDGDSLASMVLGLQSLQNWVESRSMVWLAEFAQRGQWAADGSRSLAAWVEERSHSPAKRVAAQGKLGQALRFMPVTRAAALRGELSQTPLRLLASCPTEATAELFDVKETELVGWATSMRQREFQQVLRCWAAHADPDDVTVGEPDMVKVGQLFLSESLNGCWVLNGTFNPEQGRIIGAVIFTAGEDLDRVELCDSALYRVVKDAKGAILDISRTSRLWPDPIRLAVTLRDEHCVFPGCDRPPSWCDVHHCQHWEHAGPTSLDNGALLCRHHHSFIHKAKWSVNIKPGHKPTIHKPDGTIHTIRKYQITQTGQSRRNDPPTRSELSTTKPPILIGGLTNSGASLSDPGNGTYDGTGPTIDVDLSSRKGQD